MYNGKALDVVADFGYLGMTFDCKGKFFKARSALIEQARRASFAVIKKIKEIQSTCRSTVKIIRSHDCSNSSLRLRNLGI